MSERELYQLRGVAEFLDVSFSTARRLVATGRLPAFVISLRPGSKTRRIVVRRADLLAFVESLAPVQTVESEADELVDSVLGARPTTNGRRSAM